MHSHYCVLEILSVFVYKILVIDIFFCLYALIPGDKVSKRIMAELFTYHILSKDACLQEERGNFSNPQHEIAVQLPRLSRLEGAECSALLC